ncbi:MAG: DUF1449 family protein [Myxococcaceae bacterium]|nr:DUF1449 family protein [Myxococcaceae bacterium]
MSTFLALAFSFPTAIFTTLLIVVLVYWLLVLVGAVGIELGGDGALDAKAGLIDGIDAKAGVADAHAHVHDGLEGKGALLEALGFGTVPATMIVTFLTVWGWITSMLGAWFLGPALGGFLGPWIGGGLILVLALVSAFVLSSVTARPLRPLFTIRTAPKRRHLLGKVAIVSSLRVDAKFGQAHLEDGGAGLVLPIFCTRENTLKKGDQVLLLEYDKQKEAYEIEPVEWLLPEEVSQLRDPRLAEAMARAHLSRSSRSAARN